MKMDNLGKPKALNSAFIGPLLAGGVAGLTLDLAFYPLDTFKTRLQSEQGLHKAGGFKGMYRGLLPIAITSMPTSALFFVSYEKTKSLLQPQVHSQYAPLVHMLAASIAEVLACLIRVPAEVAKQRKQVYLGMRKRSAISILLEAYKTEGFRSGVYRGFLSTLMRDLPLGFIELPVWEMLKLTVKEHNDGNITSFQSAICGSMAGAFAGALTTPLDLAKTRIMLAESSVVARKLQIKLVLADIYAESGFRGLFLGVAPRFFAFMVGGFLFFGIYEDIKMLVERKLNDS